MMEAPSSPETVEPPFNSHFAGSSQLVSSRHSRPGPVSGVLEGVFQPALPGKYIGVSSHSVPDDSVNSSSNPIETIDPGRTSSSTLEAPEPPSAVVTIQPAFNSRPGPAVGCGEGVFQPALPGKYTGVCSHSVPDNSVNSSSNFTETTDPGRTSSSTLEAPDPPSAVVTIQPALNSRPGPAVGCGEGVFQPVQSGKYSTSVGNSLPDASAPSSSLRVYYQNARGLRTKIDVFYLAVREMDYDVIVLTETWLDDRIFSSQLFGNHYSVYRTDRNAENSNKSRGGGVLIAVSSRHSSFLDPTPINGTLEQLWVRIESSGNIVSIGVLYLPPDRKNNINDIRNHIDSIGAVNSRLSSNDMVLQFGDYNLSDVYWTANEDGYASVDPVKSRLCPSSCALLDGFSFHGLSQVNTLENAGGRILDLVLLNDAVLPRYAISEAIDVLVPADTHHPAIELVVPCTLPMSYEIVHDNTGFDFKRANFEQLSTALHVIDWNSLNLIEDIDEAVEFFSNAVLQAVAVHVPPQRPPCKPPWSNSRLRLLKRRRSSALRFYSKNRSQQSKLQFNRVSDEYRRYNGFLYARYKMRIEQNLRSNPKQFWSFVNSKRNEDGLPTSMYLDELTADSARGKCELFAMQFKRAFNDFTAQPVQADLAVQDTPRDAFSFEPFDIREQDVVKAVNKLKFSYAPGPDGIPPAVLKKCCSELALPLARLLNLSLQQRTFPSSWKKSFLFPIHKKGDKRDVGNYRGITSLSACSKVFEIIINESLFASCKQYISTNQHGFFPRRSVNTNLIEFSSHCIRAMDAGQQVDAVYLDLKAAFDRVDHRILLQKLAKCGVSLNLVEWFRSYLTNRTLCVRIGSCDSEPFTNISGVPQGSNLGPLLFSLFINDASLILPPGTKLFYADDSKVYIIIDNLEDCRSLQCLLNTFEAWCERNCLTLSIEKCQVISFSRKRNPIHFPYMLSGKAIERVQRVRDLGVILDEELTFTCHYNDIISRANKQLGFVLKVTDGFKDPLSLRSLYCALVRSILEFAAVVWCPYHDNWITRIESVQRKFVRHALRNLPWRDPRNLPPYKERCRLLGIDTLENRRSTAQAMFVAKLLKGDIDSPALLADLNIYAPERTLRWRSFISLGSRNSMYGQHDPLRYMAAKFNEIFHLFDFNVTASTLQDRFNEYFRRH